MKAAATGLGGLEPTRTLALADGAILVHEGDEADDVYALVAGSLVATTSSVHGDVVVGAISPGQVVGEVTVIAGGRRTATLRAVGDSDVLVYARPDFERWLVDNPDIADSVSAQARERIDRTHVASMVTELLVLRKRRLSKVVNAW